ncbi:MAG TPA: DUF6491 family protein [Caulobacteraceae bacterium]|nr:DUF6491 family protein [Caulobacteraceae bacterium]
MRRILSPFFALTLAAAVGVSIAGAQTATPPAKAGQCFFMRDWQSWKPSADSKALFVRVGLHQVYRLDLNDACPDLQNIDARVINRVRDGADTVCGPLDLDLTVYTPPGQTTPCLVKAITPLTQDQAAALPKAEQP